jgi:hypothetical protein
VDETHDDRDQKKEEGRFAFMQMVAGFNKVSNALAVVAQQVNVLAQQQEKLIAQNAVLIEQGQSQILHMRALQEQIGVAVKMDAAREGLSVYGIPLPPSMAHNGRMPTRGGVTPTY